LSFHFLLERYAKNVSLLAMENEKPLLKVKKPKEIRGVVEPKFVRTISFIIITFSLVACTVLCILAIWEFTKSDAVWRAIATFIVVSVATGIFTFVNEKLG